MAQPFTVRVADNYHYMDESETYTLGDFDTLDEAIAACQRVVDECLTSAWKPGMTSDELMAGYCMFGDDPYIVGPVEGVAFSGREYARERCAVIAGAK